MQDTFAHGNSQIKMGDLLPHSLISQKMAALLPEFLPEISCGAIPEGKRASFGDFMRLFPRVCRISDIGKRIDTISQFATVKKFCLFGFSPPNDPPLPFLPLHYAVLEHNGPS